MPESSDGHLEYLPAEHVRSVLARAAELDASELAGLTLPDVRRIAQEAGISPRAIDQALIELRHPREAAADPVARPKERSIFSRLTTALKLGGVAAVLGLGSGASTSPQTFVYAVSVLGAVALYRAIANRREGSTSQFQAEIAAMTTGLLGGYIAGGHTHIEMLITTPVIAVITGLIGSVIVSAGRKRSYREATSEEGDVLVPGHPGATTGTYHTHSERA